ncbi:MAG: ORC1-type DNA replication protein [Crenarchaeota archaeon]|nr:ORC1-type DNA replication protein [Thermoproteota archaeon]
MVSARDLLESVIKRMSVFKNKEVLYPEYVPERLPHREEQLRQLAEIFRVMVLSPGSASMRAMLVGGVGVGKTATARVFGRELRRLARERGIEIRYIHINCHRDRTLYEVVAEMVRQMGAPIPLRGLSPREMMLALMNYMEKNNIYALVTLDEFDYFVSVAGNDAVYFIVRLYDEYPDAKKRMSFIFIARDLSSLDYLDPATMSYILKHVIRFDAYKSHELFDILADRRDQAFYEGTVDDEVIQYIADVEGVDRGGEGNARAAIEALLLAGEAADYEHSHRVTIEHVRKAFSKVQHDIVRIADTLPYLQLHELLLLKAIIRVLRKKSEPYARIGEVEEEYRSLCPMYGEEPRKHTQVYEYVNNLKKMGVIEARVSGKGFRGRSTLISVIAPLDALEKQVDSLIEKRLSRTR